MTERLTPQYISFLSVAAWALVLALVTARPELVVAAIPLLVILATTWRRTATPDYTIGCEISSERLVEGERLTVSVEMSARSRLPFVEARVPLPTGIEPVSGAVRVAMTLAPGQRSRWSLDARCPGRGTFEIREVFVRIWDVGGLRTQESAHACRRTIRVYPRTEPLRNLPRPRRTQTSVGDYVSPALGEGIEPGDIRPFVQGDRVRQVNWRASLRLGALYVTQHHRERNADIVLMLDTLASVGAPGASSLDHSIRAAMSLAAAYLARKDRVGLIEYGGLLHWVKPGSGRVQYERLADALLRPQIVFTYVAKDLALVPPRVLSPQALVVAISPLLDPRFTRAILDLAGRGFHVVVLAVSPLGLMRAAIPPFPRFDLACRLWTLDHEEKLDELRRQGVPLLDWPPGESLEGVLAAVPRLRHRLAVAL